MRFTSILSAAVAASLMLFSAGAASAANPNDQLGNLFKKSTPTASSSGQAAGAALKSLYTQYKTDGKINVSDLKTLANITTLANNIQGLKGQKLTSDYCTGFAKGLVTGSSNTVTENIAGNVTGALSKLANGTDLSGLTNAASTAAQKASAAKETVSTLTTIMGMLK